MAGDSDKDRLEALRKRIEAARRQEDDPDQPVGKSDEHYSLANYAWRMVTELVAGLIVGFGIGFGLDALFGTRPILLVLFTLAGMAAGVKTMLRTAQEMERRRAAEAERARQDEGGKRG